MPLYQKDREQLSSGADALAKLILGNRAKENEVRLQQEQKAEDLASVEAARKGLPAGTSVRIGETSVNPPDPLTGLIRKAELDNKARDDSRLETQALQTEYKKLAGYDPEQLKALEDAASLLKSNKVQTYGQLQTAISRLREKGALAEGDVNRAMPRTLRRDLKGIGAYLGLGGGVDEDVLTPEEIATVQAMLDEKSKSMRTMRQNASKEIGARAGTLAPTLKQQGQLDTTLKSLGMAADSQKQPVKKMYSPSRNQTRIIYSDGSEEIVDGRQ